MARRFPQEAKKVFEGVKFDIYQWEQKLFDGTRATFERATHKPSVQIIATINDKIVLLDEEQPFNSRFTSLVGGSIDFDEKFEDAARRELLEETGFVTEDLEFYKEAEETGHIYWDSIYFIARNCKKVEEQNLDAGERIKVRLLSFEEFIDEVAKEGFRNKGFSLDILRMKHNNKLDDFKKLIFKS